MSTQVASAADFRWMVDVDVSLTSFAAICKVLRNLCHALRGRPVNTMHLDWFA
jgi:hypothetical protein